MLSSEWHPSFLGVPVGSIEVWGVAPKFPKRPKWKCKGLGCNLWLPRSPRWKCKGLGSSSWFLRSPRWECKGLGCSSRLLRSPRWECKVGSVAPSFSLLLQALSPHTVLTPHAPVAAHDCTSSRSVTTWLLVDVDCIVHLFLLPAFQKHLGI